MKRRPGRRRAGPVEDKSEELPEPEVPGYDVKLRLGAGSYGEVWLAVQKNTKTRGRDQVFLPLQWLRLAAWYTP